MSCIDMYVNYLPYYIPTADKCVESCTDELPEVGNSKICMSCRDRYPDKNMSFWDPVTKKCVEACEETNENGACVLCADRNYNEPFWSVEQQRCLSCADAFPGEREIWNPNTRTCVPACPEETP